jgi:hypothetical protein
MEVSDEMMFAIAKMPYEMAMMDEISRYQFYANTQRLVAALEAAQTGLRYVVRVYVLSDEIKWSEEKIDEVVESIISDAKKEAGNG